MLGSLGPELGFDGIPVPPATNDDDDEGRSYTYAPGASRVIQFDPKHKLRHVLQQLANGNAGFVKDFERAHAPAR